MTNEEIQMYALVAAVAAIFGWLAWHLNDWMQKPPWGD